MMDTPLTTWLLFAGAEKHHHNAEIVTRLPGGTRHRYTFGDFSRRTKQLMNVLDTLGLGSDDVVATLAWNSYRHLEAYFAVPCSGRVLHTLNLRLSAEELAFVMNDAQDAAILVDADLLPLLEDVLEKVPSLRHVIVLADHAPTTSIADVLVYEKLIEKHPTEYAAPEIDERSPAGICYTSGTTGRPKGVVYSHRSTYLHSLAVGSAAGLAIGPSDSVLPQVPMFHANAWGMAHASVGVGAKLVLYAGGFEPGPFVDLLEEEAVTVAAGVPTVWFSAADEMGRRTSPKGRLRHIICGGSQPPQALIERYLAEYGVPIIQAWGMTETSPLASVAWPQERMRNWDSASVMRAARGQAGLPLPGIQIRLRDEQGTDVPFDGASMGSLEVRGPWVAESYLHDRGAEAFTDDGWFITGDVAIGSPDGYFVIADRTKDLIKSGGEWISSVDMEAAIMAMPDVAEAAVVAVPDEKWIERPLAYIVTASGQPIDIEQVRQHLEANGFARWQLPDEVQHIEEIPKTAVGKFDKKALRTHPSG